MENGMDYNKLKAWAGCQDWALLRETKVAGEDVTVLAGWFLTPKGSILQVETLDGVKVVVVALVPLMPPEEALDIHEPPKKPRRKDGNDPDEPYKPY